jgi:hypothetical protein
MTSCPVTTSRLLRIGAFVDKNVGSGKAVSVSGSTWRRRCIELTFNTTANTTAEYRRRR